MGGKTKLAPFIVSLIPKHKYYCEIFGGSGSVLFRKPKLISDHEIYNDINSELVNLFVQVKNHSEELIAKAFWLPYSRELFKKYIALDPTGLDNTERAVRFWYCLQSSFSAQLGGFAAGPNKKPPWHTQAINNLKDIRKRLDGVLIENLDFQECIEKYDTPETFFYLDPPYFVADDSKYYQFVFKEADHLRLKSLCQSMKGKFILSYENDVSVREFYKEFYIEETPEVDVSSSNKSEKDIVRELVISNFKMKIINGTKTLFDL